MAELNHCPLHGAVEACRCIKTTIAFEDLRNEVGMGVWQCEAGHTVIGPPYYRQANQTSYCHQCSPAVPMTLIAAGVWKRSEPPAGVWKRSEP